MNQKVFLFFISILFFSGIMYAKKVLITGGAGFIGSHVVDALLQRGDSVVVVDNYSNTNQLTSKKKYIARLTKDEDNNFSIYEADIRDEEYMRKIFRDTNPDIICHLAARAGVRASIENPQEYIDTNIIGTSVILDMAREFNVKHCVCASSSSVYGARYDNMPFCEEDSVNYQSSPYGMTKRADELLTYVYHYLFGISITNLRFFTVYGPRGRSDMVPFIFLNAVSQELPIVILGDGNAIRDFTYVDDIVDGIVRAIDTPLGYEIINLGRGEPVVLSDFVHKIETVTGKKAIINYGSSFSGDVPRTYADISKAQRLLGYNPQVSIEEGLCKMYAWYSNEQDVHTRTKMAVDLYIEE